MPAPDVSERESLLEGWNAPLARTAWVRYAVGASAVIAVALALTLWTRLGGAPATRGAPGPAATFAPPAQAAEARRAGEAPATAAAAATVAAVATVGPPDPPPPPGRPLERANRVRGLYLTGYSFGHDEKVADILAFMKRNGLNAIVADAKDDTGTLSWEMDVPLAREIGAAVPKVRDIRARMKQLRDNDIYAIARIVVFADPLLGRARPQWAIRGGQWRDRRGLRWTNPYLPEVWRYNIDVAKAAARAGFQEIQFDYVRFPEHDIDGVTHNVGQERRVAAISGFLEQAKKELEPLGVFVSADVFGLTTTTADDMKVGQDYGAVARIVDYISPMVYPSHYNPGIYGLRDPESAPKETVYQSMVHGQWKAPGIPVSVHRPWIQDFSLRVPYGKAEVEAQLRGIAEAGIRSFMLWDPSNRYTRNVDFTVVDRTATLPLPPTPDARRGAGTGPEVWGEQPQPI